MVSTTVSLQFLNEFLMLLLFVDVVVVASVKYTYLVVFQLDIK